MITTLKLMQACERAYRYDDGRGAVLSNERAIQSGPDYFDVGDFEGAPVIVVRGSDDPTDWGRNLALEFDTEALGALTGWIVERGYLGHLITITGHSRGGALAQTIALYMCDLGLRVRVVTFGSPKIPNYRAHIGRYPHRRYVNGADSIPTTPPPWYPPGWGCGHAVRPTVLAPRRRWRRWLLISGALTDHFITDYLQSYLNLERGSECKE